jgi:2-oxoglutarate ferredoxin oxidoreductase subunit alpha
MDPCWRRYPALSEKGTIMAAEELNLLIGGEAGQGLVTIGQLLGKALTRSGYEILVTQSYQSRIRGGHNTFAIRTGVGKILGPKRRLDLLAALNKDTIELHNDELGPDGLVVADSSIGNGVQNCISVPFKELASPRLLNTAALGVLGAILGLDLTLLVHLMEGLLGKKHPESLGDNRTALTNSYRWATERRPAGGHTLAQAQAPAGRMMLNGNEAIALGALAAGVKFCAFYPMTPSTSVVLSLIAHSDAMGCVVEQAEDEIAAINMALGASFAGAPSMVATSGGGFALMTEGLSLAGMTETPIVIVVAQRPGPATGLPTRTEQGDLNFVLHAGHGEFPRAIFAPGSVEACYWLTHRAFHLAESSQSPIFVLTDQFLADSYRVVDRFDIEDMAPVVPGTKEMPKDLPYRRYALCESGISPRLLPGLSTHLVVADSDEHTEDGHITEDLTVRKAMVEKRMSKLRTVLQNVVPPEFDGEKGADRLLVSWGSTGGPAQEAARELRGHGESVSTLHFGQVWPLVPAQFLSELRSAKEVVCIEGNATGQFSRLIRRETGFEIGKLVLRYDGLPFTAEYIVDALGH